jgi:hypothetical protein
MSKPVGKQGNNHFIYSDDTLNIQVHYANTRCGFELSAHYLLKKSV